MVVGGYRCNCMAVCMGAFYIMADYITMTTSISLDQAVQKMTHCLSLAVLMTVYLS